MTTGWPALQYTSWDGEHPLAILAFGSGFTTESGGLAVEWENKGPLRADLCEVQEDGEGNAYIDYYLDIRIQSTRKQSIELSGRVAGGSGPGLPRKTVAGMCETEFYHSGRRELYPDNALLVRLTNQVADRLCGSKR